ncbi:hypothetical protein niasHT_009150 [Heterodera trifolii]|uniref:Secreted protein n=1 Tax=Heterodera trifolii TaxID=157864 RepID=A0ABD2M8R5_9BILA
MWPKAQMLWRNSALWMLNLKLVVVLVYERVAYCHVCLHSKNTRHKRPKAFGLRKCPNREIRSARVSACALPSELCPAARWFFPSPGSSDAWPALCHYHLLGCPSPPMRTLALNGVVSAETIRLYKTASGAHLFATKPSALRASSVDSEQLRLIARSCTGDVSFKCLPYQLSMVVYLTTMVMTGNGG